MSSMPALKVRQFRVEVITEHYVLSGIIEPVGTLVSFITSRDKKNLHLKQITASAIDPASTLGLFNAEELYVSRPEVIAIRFMDQLSANTVPLLPHRDKVRVYLPNFVVQGIIAHGADTPLGEVFEQGTSEWTPSVEAQIFPLVQTKARTGREPATILITKHHIQFYHVVKE
jgi:hypothetical protein